MKMVHEIKNHGPNTGKAPVRQADMKPGFDKLDFAIYGVIDAPARVPMGGMETHDDKEPSGFVWRYINGEVLSAGFEFA